MRVGMNLSNSPTLWAALSMTLSHDLRHARMGYTTATLRIRP